ncbi:MAG: PhzF family phenazine biosynthesis protein [bacterium]|nr:PhzF family phenazine biosynthesis protein [bacterium]
MTSLPLALYDAFSDTAFGGSQAAVVSNAGSLGDATMARIAGELGYPAVCFVGATGEERVEARFRSTVMELPMCGHGTIALMTRLIEQGYVTMPSRMELHLPGSRTHVTISAGMGGRPLVMLEVTPPAFRQDDVDRGRLARLLGLEPDIIARDHPLETVCGDFVHLVVPLPGLDAMERVRPDFPGLVALCHDHAIETVALFTTETLDPASTLHVRDFCPAVGVAESAAAGTTNAALASYLVRHRIVSPDSGARVDVRAEQGVEIGRTSRIVTCAHIEDDAVTSIEVGGVATRTVEGLLHLPP